jgi:hypothetical protein
MEPFRVRVRVRVKIGTMRTSDLVLCTTTAVYMRVLETKNRKKKLNFISPPQQPCNSYSQWLEFKSNTFGPANDSACFFSCCLLFNLVIIVVLFGHILNEITLFFLALRIEWFSIDIKGNLSINLLCCPKTFALRSISTSVLFIATSWRPAALRCPFNSATCVSRSDGIVEHTVATFHRVGDTGYLDQPFDTVVESAFQLGEVGILGLVL